MSTTTVDRDADSRIPGQTSVIFRTSDTQQSVIDFYLLELKNNGWSIYNNDRSLRDDDWIIEASIDIEDTHNSHRVLVDVHDEKVNGKTVFTINYFDLIYPDS